MTYSNVRIETHATREYIVLQLAKLALIRDLWEDGSDLVVATFQTGERVMFHLIDYAISAHEIQKIITHNTQRGLYTLFLCWSEMMLPSDGERFRPADWMQSLLALYGDKIYGYEVSSSEVFIFPVHFDYQFGYEERLIRWGKTLPLGQLHADFLDLQSPFLNGNFRIGRLDFVQPHSQETFRRVVVSSSLHHYYQLLALPFDASAEDIRQTYRSLARQFHPDLNPAPEATEKMQALNDAYQQIMAQFDED